MTRILNALNATQTTKAYETGNYLYFNGVAHSKSNMTTIPFIPFTNGGNSGEIAFNDMLMPQYRQKYWNSVSKNNLCLDINDSNSYFFLEPNNAEYNSSTYGMYFYLNKVTEKKQCVARVQEYYKNSSSYYRYGDAVTGILGSDTSHMYIMLCESGYQTSSSSSVNPYPPTNTSYPMKATLCYVYKDSNSVSEITSFSHSSGSFKVLRETPSNIYFLIEKQGYAYDFCNLAKSTKQVTTISTFYASENDLYQNSSSGGVAPSDLIKLSDDIFESYISGQLSITGDDGQTTYKNIISKAILNVENNSVEVKQIELDQEPLFKHTLAVNYNNIFIIEKNNKRFLIASMYVPYSISLNNDDTIIQVYELDESDSNNLRGTLVQEIKQKDINGVFHGWLQGKSNNLFMAVTSTTTLAFKFSFGEKKFKILDLGITGRFVGKDTNDNFFVMNNTYEVHLFNDENIYNLSLEMPTDDFTYENADIDTNIKIWAKNIEDEYMDLEVRLVITGDAKFKNEDSQAIIIHTETSGVKEIPITITGGGEIRITPFVKL